jgi:hypothetical protein
MIKGELPGSACEILQMLGISRSFTNESLEATVFEAEVEYEQIKGRATHYDAVEPNKFDLEKRNSTNYAEISVKRSGGWTIVMARYAFVGFPPDYIESYMSNLQLFYEYRQRRDFELYLSELGLYTPKSSEDSADSFDQRSFEPTEVWKAKMRRILQTQPLNRDASFALKQLSAGGDGVPFYIDIYTHFYDLLPEEREDWKTGLEDELYCGELMPRNYDALKMLSHGGEAIHFYSESIGGERGFARFVDGRATHPIWHVVNHSPRDSIFDYDTGQWIFPLERNYVVIDFDDEVEWRLFEKHASIDLEDFYNAPTHYCYLGYPSS